MASHPEFDRATAYAVGSGLELGPVSNLTGTLFVFGHLIGTVILSVWLCGGRVRAPPWAALFLAISQPIHLASVLLGNRPLDLVGWGGTGSRICRGWLGSAADEQRPTSTWRSPTVPSQPPGRSWQSADRAWADLDLICTLQESVHRA